MAVDTTKQDQLEPPKVKLINDPRARALFFQILVLGSVLILGGIIVNNTMANSSKPGYCIRFWVPKHHGRFCHWLQSIRWI